MNKLKMHSPDLTQANIDKLAEIFPSCVAEAADTNGVVKRSIDFDQLRQELSGSIVEGPQERYQLNWPGKREALLTANAPIAKTLRPCREESVDFDTTRNLFIEGDNLDALKLLRETYLNKVKLIYIDPPYNTGTDFVYKDNYAETTEDYLRRSNQKDDLGDQMVANTESNGRFHSDWLSMIFSRVKHAKNLLTDDGLLAISIDDCEISNLLHVVDEIFGWENRKVVCVKMSEPSGLKMGAVKRLGTIPKVKEYLVLCGKNGVRGLKLERIQKDSWDSEYNIFIEHLTEEDRELIREISERDAPTDHDVLLLDRIGNRIRLVPVAEKLRVNGLLAEGREKWLFENAWRICQCATSSSVLTLAVQKRQSNKNEVFFVRSATGIIYMVRGTFSQESSKPRVQLIFADDNLTVHPGDLWSDIKTTGLDGEGEVSFKNGKKPLKLLNRIIGMATRAEDLILDFFAGSGSTGHALMQANFSTGSTRRFILVQLPEEIDGKDKDQKESFQFCTTNGLRTTVAELTKARLRRAGRKIKLDNAGKPGIDKLDIGFRVLKVDTSNMKEVFYTPDAVSQDLLSDQVNNIREDRTAEDLLFQVLLAWGVDLALPISKEDITGKSVYFVDGNALAACFDEGVNEDFVKLLAKREPLRVVFRDAGFASDSVKINVEQIFKLMSPSTEVKTI